MTPGRLTLSFAGAAGTVTGSRHVVSIDGRPLLLDCGLFQGSRELRKRNSAPPPFDPARLIGVLLSHGHLDHCGYLPVLKRHGFTGPVHCTSGTAELAAIVLRDAARLQQEDADAANDRRDAQRAPIEPLFTAADAERAIDQFIIHAYGERFAVSPQVSARFRRAGHILGSASIELEITTPERPTQLRIVFSGDLGRWGRPILRDPETVPGADILLVESTYGDRVHTDDAADALADVINATAARDGVVAVPAFAIGRTQELVWTLRQLEEARRIPSLPVYVDSPMAIRVSDVYCRHPEDHDLDMQLLMDEKRCPLCCRQYHLLRDAGESRALTRRSGPMIVIAGSGMATGGRVLHHLRARLPDARNTVLVCGYQALGTLGRALQSGASTIRIHGEDVEVAAQVRTIDGLSAHGDRNDLLRWLRGFEHPPAHTFVVHGEPPAAAALVGAITDQLHWNASAAQDAATVDLFEMVHPTRSP